MADGAARGRRALAQEGPRAKQSYFSDSDSSAEGAAVGAAPKEEPVQAASGPGRRSAELEEEERRRQTEGLRRRNAELEEESRRLQARCGELEGRCGDLQGRCSELDQALQRRGQELEARAAELEALREDSAALQALRVQLPAALGRARRSVAEAAQLRERERRSTTEEGERELRLRDELMTELSALRLEDEARARALGEQLRRQQERCAEEMRQVLRARAEASAAAAAEEELRRAASAAAAPGAAGTAHLEALLRSISEQLRGLCGEREAGFAQRAPVSGPVWVCVRDTAAQTER
mmetsp:Transcript_92534/g.248164  ORF Transcript_92534/g.248164 Transcript_92534/m.248164 type:complete len:296 (+) Transcript_92534:94-981(+)